MNFLSITFQLDQDCVTNAQVDLVVEQLEKVIEVR